MNNLSFPREIIKWIQSLNLQNSLRDLKRDLINGFYIAEIIKKYYPRQISMHSFTNSENRQQKKSNWLMLKLTFKKIDFEINLVEYENIQKGDFDKLILFLSKLYKFLTKKKIEVFKKPLADLNGKTRTFLLTETGLEKIDLNKKKMEITENYPILENLENNSFENSENKENSENGEKSKMDVSPSEIAKILENQNKKKNIGTKNQMISKSKLRSQFNLNKIKSRISVKKSQKTKFHNESENLKNSKFSKNSKNQKNLKNEESYKMINERLNEYLSVLDEKFSNECFLILQNSNYLYYDYSLHINNFLDKFNIEFFEKIENDIFLFAKFLIKDDTELYKFFIFLVNIVINLDHNKISFVNVILLIKKIFLVFKKIDFEKCFLILKHFFVDLICDNLKKMDFEKKYFLVKIIFFIIPENEEIKEKVFNLFIKEKKFLIEIISVFLENEKIRNEKNENFLEKIFKFLKYVKKTNFCDTKIALAKILGQLCKIDINFIKKNFEKFNFLFCKREYCLEIKCYLLIFLFEFWKILEKEEKLKICTKKRIDLQNSEKFEKSEKKNFFEKILEKLEILLEEENEYFKRVFFINFGVLLKNEKLLKFYFSKLLLCSENLIEYIFSKNNENENFVINSGDFVNTVKLNEIKKNDFFLYEKLFFILQKNKNLNESLFCEENQNLDNSQNSENFQKKKNYFFENSENEEILEKN